MARRPLPAAPTKDGPPANEDISAPTLRVIDENGENVGVIDTREALGMAGEVGLDLVVVSPNANPPVAKFLDLGKYKYEEQKRKHEARKKQKTIEIKEIKLRPGIEEHDFGVKMKKVREFIDNGDKVKVTMRFRGREMAHQELGMDVLDKVKAMFGEDIKIEQDPKLEGRQMIMVIAPR